MFFYEIMKAIKWEQGFFSAKYLFSGLSRWQPKLCRDGGRGTRSAREPTPLTYMLRAQQGFCMPLAPCCAQLEPCRAVMGLCPTSYRCWKERAFMVSLCPSEGSQPGCALHACALDQLLRAIRSPCKMLVFFPAQVVVKVSSSF